MQLLREFHEIRGAERRIRLIARSGERGVDAPFRNDVQLFCSMFVLNALANLVGSFHSELAIGALERRDQEIWSVWSRRSASLRRLAILAENRGAHDGECEKACGGRHTALC